MTYNEGKQMYDELRELAMKSNIPIITATQIHRNGCRSTNVRQKFVHISGMNDVMIVDYTSRIGNT